MTTPVEVLGFVLAVVIVGTIIYDVVVFFLRFLGVIAQRGRSINQRITQTFFGKESVVLPRKGHNGGDNHIVYRRSAAFVAGVGVLHCSMVEQFDYVVSKRCTSKMLGPRT